ncbi:hypothetical protein SNE40_016537 [Patella caerulea]|uniref:Uncharacterized protein n=1 Tax=Patella caerulea TaxID=87958 RepID=A0AAN8PCC9_PATCE
MFRWLKKKYQRRTMSFRRKRLFKPARDEAVQENEYHDEVAYAVVSLEHSKFDHQEAYPAMDCPGCKYGRLDQDFPCVCQVKKMTSWEDFDSRFILHSSSVMAIDKLLTKNSADVTSRSCNLLCELAESCDSSSGYNSSSLHSLDRSISIGIEDSSFKHPIKMDSDRFNERGGNSVTPRMGCKVLQRRRTRLIQPPLDDVIPHKLPQRTNTNTRDLTNATRCGGIWV